MRDLAKDISIFVRKIETQLVTDVLYTHCGLIEGDAANNCLDDNVVANTKDDKDAVTGRTTG